MVSQNINERSRLGVQEYVLAAVYISEEITVQEGVQSKGTEIEYQNCGYIHKNAL